MPDYRHGPYAEQEAVGSRVATESQSAIVIFGTAPVHTVEGGGSNVNKAVLVSNIAEARKKFGYNSDWAKYTLCEAIHYMLEVRGVGPLVLVNVLNPATHKETEAGTKSLTPANGRVTIAGAAEINLDSVVVKSGSTTKVKGTDYTISYNYSKETITIQEITSGALGTSALTITYDIVKPDAVTQADLIGSTDNNGLNTGLFAMKNVYQQTGMIPAYIMAPGWSHIPAVHTAMYQNSRKIGSHWDAWMLTDIPITDGENAITLDSAYTWKNANGYNRENETVNFPMVEGTDDNYYHMSVIRAANELQLLAESGGIPYRTASNKEAAIIRNLWMGASNTGRIYDDDLLNEKLCKNGICSAAFVGGRWALWGAHAANYNQESADNVNVKETTLKMMFYITNDFQHRNFHNIDEALSPNDIESIMAIEQSRIDALVNNGMLTYGVVYIDASESAKSDMLSGDYTFSMEITTTPLAKSLTAKAIHVDDGFAVYYDEGESDAA